MTRWSHGISRFSPHQNSILLPSSRFCSTFFVSFLGNQERKGQILRVIDDPKPDFLSKDLYFGLVVNVATTRAISAQGFPLLSLSNYGSP